MTLGALGNMNSYTYCFDLDLLTDKLGVAKQIWRHP